MSVWKTLLKRTPPPSPRRDAIEAAFIAQSKALVELVKQHQETIDRIVTARYDRPIPAAGTQVRAEQMPMFAMNDQGDVLPLLSTESDTEFLKTVGAK